MELGGLLPYPQESATAPYPETGESSPNSLLILFSHICLGFSSIFFPSGFASEILYAFNASCVLHVSNNKFRFSFLLLLSFQDIYLNLYEILSGC